MDVQWLDRARAGDAESFERIIAHHERALYALARVLCSSEEDALDACQDAILRAWRAIERFEGTAGDVGPWLARIVRNCCFDRGRQVMRIVANTHLDADALEGVLDTARSPEELAAAGDLAAVVERAVARLPVDQRMTLALSRADFSYDEIAAALGIARGTVKSRIARARVTLRALLAGNPLVEPFGASQRSDSEP